jgi:nucleoside 2-deoxyribosyltransferase
MKIYFAGSIRGGRDDQGLYLSIIKELQKYGTVLTEHIGNEELSSFGETESTDEVIFERDMNWLRGSDVVVAEVTTPSLGVGYELGQIETMNKETLCLYREVEGKRLSSMIGGNSYFSTNMHAYKDLEDVESILAKYFESKN